jgi:hypothetical protein
MQEHASTIKRPVVEWADGKITVGFKADEWDTAKHISNRSHLHMALPSFTVPRA